MNDVVWKFGPLYSHDNTFEMPKDAKILSAGFQGDDLYVWALVDALTSEKAPRRIGVVPTGLESLPHDGFTYNFIGTAIHDLGTVWHVFEAVDPKTSFVDSILGGRTR